MNIEIINADLVEQDYNRLIEFLDSKNFNWSPQQNDGKPDVGRSFAIVRWSENQYNDVVCINREIAEAYVEIYNKLSGEQSCYVDDDIYKPLTVA